FCNGEIIPSNPALNTVVEFAHRVTSGIALPLVFWLVWQAFRLAPRGAAVRKAAAAAGVFIVLEAALGAGLVLFKYVAYNPSYARAVWMAGHLVNTLLLLGALTLVAWWASGGSVPRRLAPGRALAVGAALVAVLVLAMGGAVTALGDTLVVGGGLDPTVHPVVATLVGLRLFHPAMAFVALGVVAASVWQSRGTAVVARGTTVLGLFVAQMGLGALNVGLNVPVWMQIIHLLMTDVVWIALVIWAAEALAAGPARSTQALRAAV
ncbi:MAG TPA: COX15/CtaA family protein, partial [Rubricoccaceae bacterium]